MKDILSKIILTLDLFSAPFQVKLLNKARHQSYLGSFLTILIASLGLSIFLSAIDPVINKTKPSVNRDVIYETIAPNSTTAEVSSFSFRADTEAIHDPTIFLVEVKNFYLLEQLMKQENQLSLLQEIY